MVAPPGVDSCKRCYLIWCQWAGCNPIARRCYMKSFSFEYWISYFQKSTNSHSHTIYLPINNYTRLIRIPSHQSKIYTKMIWKESLTSDTIIEVGEGVKEKSNEKAGHVCRRGNDNVFLTKQKQPDLVFISIRPTIINYCFHLITDWPISVDTVSSRNS